MQNLFIFNFNKSSFAFRYFVSLIITLTGLMLLIITISSGILYVLKEIYSVDEVIEIQMHDSNSECLYGSAINNPVLDYKKKIYNIKKPKIVMLGSSKALQYRGSFFSKSFYNFGGTVSSLNQLDDRIDELLEISKPEYMYVFLDFWWFNSNYKANNENKDVPENVPGLSLSKIIKPYFWLFSGKLKFSHFKNLKENNDLCSIGASASIYSQGFAKDGSYYYTPYIIGEKKSNDVQFIDTIDRIENGVNKFDYGNNLDDQDIFQLIKLSKKLKNHNVVSFFVQTPVAPSVFNKMGKYKNEYEYIQKLKNKLESLDIKYFDYTDPKIINASDCEFIDGFHAGDYLSAKLLLNMSKNSSLVSETVNINYLKSIAISSKNIAMIHNDQVMRNEEVDFLKLGCVKFPNI